MIFILSLISAQLCFSGSSDATLLKYDFAGDTITIAADTQLQVNITLPATTTSVQDFYNALNNGNYQAIIDTLLTYKEKHNLNDWLFYQLVRRTAEQLSPKSNNYERYTLYKWFLLAKSGYDARLAVTQSDLLFYVKSNDNIYDVPYYMEGDQQFVCLNIHDYGKIDFNKSELIAINVKVPEATKTFSYKVTQIPEFSAADYAEKNIQFSYNNQDYHFKLLLANQVQNMFTNYPVVDYESYFNIPLSNKTYNSLIPPLKNIVKDMKQKKGVDYLMRFTRNAFLYANDQENFGKEKRMSPEQTLGSDRSDCDDRAALFFYLVKEIYHLPMVVMLYPTHVTIAVKFDKASGPSILYKNSKYAICDPTPQAQDLSIGEVSDKLKDTPYQIAYEYNPE